jgi:hypothetical protein
MSDRTAMDKSIAFLVTSGLLLSATALKLRKFWLL